MSEVALIGRRRIYSGMAPFDDATDQELGAACNRLAAWVEPMAEGTLIDAASELTESDLALILRHLHANRRGEPIETATAQRRGSRSGRASVPITARD